MSTLSRSLDDPESPLDALTQAALCKDVRSELPSFLEYLPQVLLIFECARMQELNEGGNKTSAGSINVARESVWEQYKGGNKYSNCYLFILNGSSEYLLEADCL